MSFVGVQALCRFGLGLALAVLVGGPTASAAPSAMSVEASTSSAAARLRFLWPDRVSAKVDVDGRAVVATVDREIDRKAVRDAIAMVPSWIESVESDGQRLRIVPAAGRSATVGLLPRGVEVRLVASAATPSPTAAVPPPAQPPQTAASPAPVPQAAAPAAPAQATLTKPPLVQVASAAPQAPMIGAVTVVPGSAAQGPSVALSPPVDPEAAAARRRLRLTEARLMMETGDAEGAKAELERLMKEVPNSVEVMAALASAETQLGGWRRAVGLYDRALGLNPDDPAMARAKAELLREHGPRLRVDIDHRKVDKADRQIVARASGEAISGSASTVGMAVEGNDLKAPVVRRPNGGLESFDGRRVRGEGYVSLDHETGGISRFSLIGGNGVVGGAIRHTRPLGDGTLRLGAILQDPYWDVVDGLVNEARTDRVQIGYERLIGTDWRVAGRLAGGRYGIDGRSGVASFIGPSFELAYTAVQGPPSVTVAYGLDAEYLSGRKTAVDAFGSEYTLLSVVSREVHSGTVGLAGSFTPESRYNLYGGYAYDRLNANGPFLGADIAFEPSARLEFGFVASHSLAASRGTDATVTRVGGYLLWRL